MMRTANPALNQKTFTSMAPVATAGEAMTLQGTVNKTGILLVFLLITVCSWEACLRLWKRNSPGSSSRRWP
jgi:uncharacterized YccA/Bax inhibitor family protein